ncbi:hypothetical protein [Sulfurimonas sp.]
MSYEDTVDYLCKLLENHPEGYSINSAEVREFLDNYDGYYEALSKKKDVDLDWIVKLIKGEN